MNRHEDDSTATLDYGDGDRHLFEAFEALRPDPVDYAARLRTRIDDRGNSSTSSRQPLGSDAGTDVDERTTRRPGELFKIAFRRAATWLPPVLLPASIARAAGIGAAAAAKTKGAKAAAAWILGLPGLVVLLIVALGVVGLRATRKFEAHSFERLRDRPSRLARVRRREMDRHDGIAFAIGVFPFLSAATFPDLVRSWAMPLVLALGLALLYLRRHQTGCAEREVLASDARKVLGSFALTEVLLVAFSPGLADPIHAIAALLAYVFVGTLPAFGSPLPRVLERMAGPLFRIALGLWFLAAPALSAEAFGAKWPGLLLFGVAAALAAALRGICYILAGTRRFGLPAGIAQVLVFGIAPFLAFEQADRAAEHDADRWLVERLGKAKSEFGPEIDPRLNEWTIPYDAATALGVLAEERERLPESVAGRSSALTRWILGWIDRDEAYEQAVTGEETWSNDFTRRLCDPSISEARRVEIVESIAGLDDFEHDIERGLTQPTGLWFAFRLLERVRPDEAAERMQPPVRRLIEKNYQPARHTFALRSRFESPSYNLCLALLIHDLAEAGFGVEDSIDLHRFRRSLRSLKSEPENRIAARLLDGIGPAHPSEGSLWDWWLPAGLTLLVAAFAAATALRAPSIRSPEGAGLS